MSPSTTTRPIIPPYSSHPALQTTHPNITLRPFRTSDLPALHELRSQIDVMKWTSTGVVDANIEKTQSWMGRFMDLEEQISDAVADENGGSVTKKIEQASAGPNSFNFVVVYRELDAGGEQAKEKGEGSEEVIGAAGIHSINPIPEAGYMIRTEYWGRGIATAIVKAFMDAYWRLERTTIPTPVPSFESIPPQIERGQSESDESKLGVEERPLPTREYVKATLAWENIGSRRVLEKSGFLFWRFETVVEFGEEVVLGQYFLERPAGV